MSRLSIAPIALISLSFIAACGPEGGAGASSIQDAGSANDVGAADAGGGEVLGTDTVVTDAGGGIDDGDGARAGDVLAGDIASADASDPSIDGGKGGAADVVSSDKGCTFNVDCPSHERCECSAGDCKCKVGPRGTGKSGVDLCKDGNDCESSLCAEGPGDVYYCSGPCTSAKDCGPKMPVCASVAFIGQICIRVAPGG